MIRSRTVIDALALALVLVLTALPAAAGDAQIAEQLFLEGKALMKDRQYLAACAKFQASHDIDHSATGTLLNLALCHELTNRPATAWAEFRQVAAESSGRTDDRVAVARLTLAREHEAKLFPTLSHLTLSIATPDVPGLTVRIDRGSPIDHASWGVELPIDPGKHVVEATAPGKVPVRVEVEVGAEADRRTTTIPVLGEELALPPSPQPGSIEAAPKPWRVVGLAAGGVGLAAGVVGLVFGATARSRSDAANDLCPGTVCRDFPTKSEASAKLASAHDAATVANVLVGVGALLVAGGVVMYLIGSPGRAKHAALSRYLDGAIAIP